MSEIRLGGITYTRDANRDWQQEAGPRFLAVRDDLARALDLIERLQAAAQEQRR